MAFSVDATSSGTTTGSSSAQITVTQTHVVGATANWLFVMVSYGGNGSGGTPTLVAPTWNGTSMTLIANYIPGSLGAGGDYLAVYGLSNPATGSHSIVTKWTPNSTASISWLGTTGISFIGAAVTQSGAVTGSGEQGNSTYSNGVATNKANSIVIGWSYSSSSGGQSLTGTNSLTTVNNGNFSGVSNRQFACAYQTTTSTGTYDYNVSLTGGSGIDSGLIEVEAGAVAANGKFLAFM